MAREIAREAMVLDLADIRRQGELIVEQARKRAEKLIADAQAERARLIAGAAEKGREDGKTQGIAEGRKAGAQQGREAAMKEYKAKVDAIVATWTAATAELTAARESMLSEARTDLIRLAAGIAEKIVKRHVQVNPETVVDQLEAVLRVVMHASELVVAVNPDDRGVLAEAVPELLARFDGVKHVALVDDAGLARGSCVVRTRQSTGSSGGGEIDASIATQLERIVEAIVPSRIEGDA
jgi:flagellar assembly protein FliH